MNCLLFSDSIKDSVSLAVALVSCDEDLNRAKLGAGLRVYDTNSPSLDAVVGTQWLIPC